MRRLMRDARVPCRLYVRVSHVYSMPRNDTRPHVHPMATHTDIIAERSKSQIDRSDDGLCPPPLWTDVVLLIPPGNDG